MAGLSPRRVSRESALSSRETPLGDVDYGHERPDVGNKFPLIAASRHPGFSFNASVDRSKLKGEHVISIELELGDGTLHNTKVSVATTEATSPSTILTVSDILLNIDQPQILNGAAIRTVDGTLSITGSMGVVAREGIASIELELDDRPVGKAYLGIRREDVAQVHPDCNNSLLSGFSFSLPQRVLVQGRHGIGLRISTELKRETSLSLRDRCSGNRGTFRPLEPADNPADRGTIIDTAGRNPTHIRTQFFHLGRLPQFHRKIAARNVTQLSLAALQLVDRHYHGTTENPSQHQLFDT